MFSHHPDQIAFSAEARRPLPRPLFDHARAGIREATVPSRAAWADQCLRRLRELRPHEDPLTLWAMVDDMSHDVSGVHPVLAAEMEHECWD